MAEARKKVVKKRVPNGVWYTDGTIRIDNVRFSHPHIHEAWGGTNDDGTPQPKKFSVQGLLDKKTHKEVVTQLIVPRINELLAEAKVDKLAREKKFCRDGDDGDKPEAYGHYTVSAREDRRPAVRTADKTKLAESAVEEMKRLFYGGAYGSILIRPWYQSGKSKSGKDYGKRVNAGLQAIQFVRHGEPFGEGHITDEEVDDVFESYDDEDNGGFDDDGLGSDDDLGGL